MTDQTAATQPQRRYPCESCGARVEYAPGTNVLRCPYCGHEQRVTAPTRPVQEHHIEELATLPRKPVGQIAPYNYVCRGCGAQTQSATLSDSCQFCGAPLVADASSTGQIVPEAVLPFALDEQKARQALRQWTSSRWFAPSALKKVTTAESTKGTYVPHWTYDSQTITQYRGQRGVHYYTTESYTDSNGNTHTRQVQHTRWYPAAGEVRRFFNDVLVVATTRLPPDKLDKLEPWPLPSSVAFQPDYLAGYHTLRYEVEPEQGLNIAKRKMDPVIRGDVRGSIGGDEQRIEWMNTNYYNIMYKLMLLPVWKAFYVYSGKDYHVMINACTGEVLGERPYSTPKIVAACLGAAAIIAAIITLIVLSQN